jgi:hypothetical protein
MAISKITVDLTARTFTIEVPDEKIESILEKVEALFDKTPTPPPQVTSPRDGPSPQEPEGEAPEQSQKPTPASTRRRGKGPSKIKSWEISDLGLDTEQRQSIRDFYTQKSPTGQGESVAVLIVKASSILGKKEFDGNDLHSLFKIVDLPTPRNLTAVFGNMKRDGVAKYEDNKVIVTSFTEDEVNFKLPKTAKA